MNKITVHNRVVNNAIENEMLRQSQQSAVDIIKAQEAHILTLKNENERLRKRQQKTKKKYLNTKASYETFQKQTIKDIETGESKIRFLEERLSELTQKHGEQLASLNQYISSLELSRDTSAIEYRSIKNSLSWKSTKPIRWILDVLIRIISAVFERILFWIRKNEKLRARLEVMLLKLGPVGQNFFRFAIARPYNKFQVIDPIEYTTLSDNESPNILVNYTSSEALVFQELLSKYNRSNENIN
jgi:hypothetical protein